MPTSERIQGLFTAICATQLATFGDIRWKASFLIPPHRIYTDVMPAPLKTALPTRSEMFRNLIDTDSEKFFHAAFRIVRNEEDAREIVQEGITKAYDRYDQFEGKAALSSWVYRIIVNEALQRVRSKRHKVEESMDPFLPKFIFGHHRDKIPDWKTLPLERLERTEFRSKLQDWIEEFPEDFQKPYLLKDFEGWSEKEISEEMQIPLSTVKSRLHKIRLVLRKKVEHYLAN